jgi:hypothetical protein
MCAAWAHCACAPSADTFLILLPCAYYRYNKATPEPKAKKAKTSTKVLGNPVANQLTSSYADLLAEIKSKQARLLESGQVDQSKSGSDEYDSDKD